MKLIVKTTFFFLILLVPAFSCFANTPPVPNPRRVPPPPAGPIDQWIWLVFAIGILFAFISYKKKLHTK